MVPIRKTFLAALVLATLWAAGSAQAGDRAELFQHPWVSTAVLKDGERHPLFEGTKVRVNFEHRAEYDVVRWRADCNVFGADVDVTEKRLVTGQIEQTDVGCSGPPLRRDRWMARFFRSDPRWRIRREGRLKLRAGDRVIRLTSPQPGK